MLKSLSAVPILLLALTAPTRAETALSEAAQDYVNGAVIGTLYHEMGHALIDVLGLPVLGQEEDAADVLAVVLAHGLWEEDYARTVAWATAYSFQLSSEEGNETVFWDVHGPDEQRYFNTVCLFYGADPEGRADFARDLDLPADRASTCADGFATADASWGVFLDEIALYEEEASSGSFSFSTEEDRPEIAELLRTEVTDLNGLYRLPVPIAIVLEPCDEVNAYYFTETHSITICTEYVDYLVRQALDAGL